MARAGILLILFVAVTVLVLGEIHSTGVKAASGPVTTSTTSTTRPAHPTTTTTTVAPNKVPVLVANASGVTGAAATVSTELAAGGWELLAPVNASARVPSSHVYYVAGFQQEAATIASSLHLPPSVVAPYTTAAPISSIGTAEVVVVVGPDLTTPSTASTTTSSTAH